jgi:hypothetical protein
MVPMFRAIQTGFIWLTAVTTLIAGVPHFDCLCPNGRHKPFCSGIVSSHTGCCCGGSCCSSSAGKACCQAEDSSPRRQAPCCGDSQPPNADARIPGIHVSARCCQKTFAQEEFVGVCLVKKSDKQNLTERFSVPLLPLAADPTVPQVRRPLPSGLPYELPPPPDLVIALQHFLI